ILSLERLARLFSVNPSGILNLKRGALTKGARADITVLDMERKLEIRPEEFASRSRNTPFAGWKLCGGPALTIVNGKIVWSV
ncbi:MAG: amidohydrolase family protein, partial [Acidobacteria bacterium]|nr:amidohydrolase family protein [Acidobacteriota bacterium]